MREVVRPRVWFGRNLRTPTPDGCPTQSLEYVPYIGRGTVLADLVPTNWGGVSDL